MSSSSFSLSLNPTLFLHSKPRKPPPIFPIPSVPSPYLSLNRHSFQALPSSSDAPNHSLEDSRWLREEQRWLREEQRWLREEQRWARERESLLKEIAQLRIRVQSLQLESTIQVLKEQNLIAESGSSASPMVFDDKDEQKLTDEKVVRVLDEAKKEEEKKSTGRPLRIGAEGEEVKALQDALQKLGFYSGEEDVEYCSFSSGTERAVKTWQASIGAKEDGVMTEELLKRLYLGQLQGASSLIKPDEKEGANGAAVASVTQISEYEQTTVKESESEIEVSQHRVFLLGENRWEEPSRLGNRNKRDAKSKNSSMTTKCLACRGEGRLLCTECDGTGEPNIEPQFMEWVGEGAKCPYCEGLGHTICDVCDGKTVI